MSSAEALDDALGNWHDFQLDYSFDDDREPTEVTLFPTEQPGLTTWISIGVEHAVPLEECR